MKQEEFEIGLVEYVRKELKNYKNTINTIVYSTYFMEQSYLVVDSNFFKQVIKFNITEFINKNLFMKYPSCLDMIEKNYIVVNVLYTEIYSIIKKEFSKKMDKAYSDYYKEESGDDNINNKELETAHLQSEIIKYKSLYQNLQSQLQTVKSIINKIEV